MPLDPVLSRILGRMSPADAPPMHTLPLERVRQVIERLARSDGVEAVHEVADLTIPGPAGGIPTRCYRPGPGSDHPVVAYFHGGGWATGSLDSHDGVCRSLANRSGCVVVSVGYRLAPESPFPAALNDCYTAVEWLSDNATRVGGRRDLLMVAGDSAGGNLAAAVALKARDEDGPTLALQVLVYPVLDSACDTASYHENADGYLLTADMMRWFWAMYTSDPEVAPSPLASPLRSPNLHRLPQALVITAEYDPLRDEGEAFADRLRTAGVVAECHRFDGMVHGFLGMAPHIQQANEALDMIAAAFGFVARSDSSGDRP